MTHEEMEVAIRLFAAVLCRQYETNVEIFTTVDALLEAVKESDNFSQEHLDFWAEVQGASLGRQRENDEMLQVLRKLSQG